MTKLKVWELTGESRRFVFSNLDVMMAHIKIIAPLVLLFEAIKFYAVAMGHTGMQLAAALPGMFLYAFFALSWHRSSLRGASAGHAINLARTTREDWAFIGVFFVVAIIPMIVMGVAGFVTGLIGHYAGQAGLIVAVITLILAGIFFMIFMIRVTFMLPARSVGVKLPWREAVAISQGAVWPLMGAGIIFGICFLVVFAVYTAVMLGTIYVATGTLQFEGTTKFIVDLVFNIPVILGTFLMIALNITTLSKAYQWGAQNNQI